MRVIDDAVQAARRGRGSVVFIEAVAGMGKTGLLGAAAERARARGLRVLTARGGELERDLAWGVVRQLFVDAARASSLDGPAVRAAQLLDLTGHTAPETNAGDDPTGTVLHGLYWLTANLPGPLGILVDDLHWADPASLRFIGYLAHRVDGLSVVLVAAARPSDQPATPDVIGALKRLPVTRRLALPPLTIDAVDVLVRGAFPDAESPVDAAFSRACATATGGNPFLLRALLATMA